MAYNAASHNATGDPTGPVSGAPPPVSDETKAAILEASKAQTSAGGQDAGSAADQKEPAKQKTEKELARERAKAEKEKKFKEKQAKQAAAKANAQPAKIKEKPKKAEAEEVPPYVEETPKGAKKILKPLDDAHHKAYHPAVVESAWMHWWQKEGFFEPDLSKLANGTFVIPIPPPNVTGALHIGHALANSLQDCLIRYNRMLQKTVLFLPGCDHAGISTQSVVENMLWRREGKTRHDLGREAMVKRIWDWKGDYHARIVRVLNRLGGSYDWGREAFTMDENLSKAVTQTFCQMYDEGYIFREERLVNWCTRLQTAMSNLEVDNKELPGRTLLDVPGYEKKVEFGIIMTFKYPIEGGGEIAVATTRPETMLGDSGIAVHPDDERYKHVVGKNAIHPFIPGRKLPIVADPYVEKDFGTGAVKLTPAHDQNDFNLGKKHNLELINIFTDDGLINENGGEQFKGQRRFDARYTVTEALKQKGLYVETKDNAMTVPLCSRTKDIIEPRLLPQWWMKVEELAANALKVVEDGTITIRPDTALNSYKRWMSNIQPWCLSRQLWWGHQIPAYRVLSTSGEELGWVVAPSHEEAQKKASEKYPDHAKLQRDSDVLDTWFSSGLWPFSTLGWPNDSEDMKNLFPTSMLETGWDILFFWVARMIMLSLKLTGKVPFNEVYCHSLVRDSEGRKMSKSLGNVIDPVDIIEGISLDALNAKLKQGNLDPKELVRAEKYQKTSFPKGIPECGSDALRFSLIQYTTGGGDIAFDVKVMEGYRRFMNKIYQATKYVLGNFDKIGADFKPQESISKSGKETLAERWILSRFVKAAKTVSDQLEAREFSRATSALYSLFYDDLCDVFIENSKAIISDGSPDEKQSALNTLYNVLEGSLRMMHPFIPFLTEELWQRLPRRSNDPRSITIAQYPLFDAKLVDEESEAAYNLVLGIAKGIRSLIAEYKIDNAKIIIQTLNATANETITSQILAIKSLSGKNWSSVDTLAASDAAPTGCAVFAVSTDAAVFMKLEGDIDVEEEIKKAQQKLKKAAEGVSKQMKLVGAPDFKEKVSTAVQEEEHKKLAEYEAQQNNYEKTIQQFETMKLEAK